MSNCWRYKKKSICSINDIPKEFKDSEEIQILYKITCKPTGNWYIGKKIFFNTKKVRLSKKKKLDLKTRKVFEYKKVESNWANYYGSSTNIEWLHLIDTLGHDKFDREILMFVEGKTKAAFYEAKYLFSDEGMMNDKCMNLNILSKFFKNKLK
jgi:hypothetical protein